MASWVRQISIEDDWQEVDDAGSVKSLSTLYSDDSHERSDSDTVDLGRPSVSSSAEDPAHLRTDSSTPTTEQPIEPRPNTEIIAPPAGTLRAADANPEPNVTTDELGDHTSTEHQVSSPTPQEDLEFLQNGLQQLHRLLGEAIHGTELYLNHSTGIPAILMIRDTSKLLREQLFELHPIVQDCAEHWNTHGRDTNPSEIPLNANLLEWTKSLRKCLLRFQSQMDITAPINKENNDVQIPPTPASPAMAFALLGIELEDLHLAMADFLPIIKS